MANFRDPGHWAEYLEQSQQLKLYVICSMFIFLSTIAVALRFISRQLTKSLWKLDDTLFLIAYAFSICWSTAVIVGVRYAGIGLHEIRVTQDASKIPLWGKMTLIDEYLYITTVTAPKLAVLTGFGSCIPLEYLCKAVKTGHCFNFDKWYRWVRVISILSDIAVIALPIPLTLRLQMPTRKKLGLLFTFSLGGLGLIAVIITIFVMSTKTIQKDNTWSTSFLQFWGTIEAGMYLISPCMVYYPPLWKIVWCRVMKKGAKTQTPTEEQLQI